MPRWISALIVLAVIVTAGSISIFTIENFYSALEERLQKIENHARDENWKETAAETKKLDEEWSGKRRLLLIILDHRDVNLTSVPIESMKTYIAFENKEQFILQCRLLGDVIKTVKENQMVNLINIF